jgi:hypothetical protein
MTVDDDVELVVVDVTSGKGDGAVSINECIGSTLLLDEANAFLFCAPDVSAVFPLLRFKVETVSSSVELNIRHPGFDGGGALLFVFDESPLMECCA